MNTKPDDPNRQQDLEKENAELRRRLAEHDRVESQRVADEETITEKMSRGLSREQAINVIKRQREFDAAKMAAK